MIFLINFQNFPEVQPPDPLGGKGNPLPAPIPSTAFHRAWGREAPQLRGPKMKLELDPHNVGDGSAPMSDVELLSESYTS